jgi:hypothetical protein
MDPRLAQPDRSEIANTETAFRAVFLLVAARSPLLARFGCASMQLGWGPNVKRKMFANVLPSIFTIEIGGKPTLVFEAKNLHEAHELCHEKWLRGDLAEAKSDGVPLWDGRAKLRARMALPDEIALFVEAKNGGDPSDGLMLVYLVELDGEAPP